MRKIICVLLAAALCLTSVSCALAQSADASEGDLLWFFTLYGYNLPESAQKAMQTFPDTEAADCGPARVTPREVLYDGLWLYTSAYIAPVDPETTLLMPGSAEVTDMVCGGYGEALRDDSRSFLDAAAQDGKRLIAVYVYPAEFDTLGEYFTDHRQDAGDRSTVFSGAAVRWLDKTREMHLSVQLYEIDLTTQMYSSIGAYEYAVQVRRIGELNEKTYRPAGGVLPITAMTLYQTPLAVYMSPEWTSDEVMYSYEYALLDGDQNPMEGGASPETTSLMPFELPEAFDLLMCSYDEPSSELLIPMHAADD